MECFGRRCASSFEILKQDFYNLRCVVLVLALPHVLFFVSFFFGRVGGPVQRVKVNGTVDLEPLDETQAYRRSARSRPVGQRFLGFGRTGGRHSCIFSLLFCFLRRCDEDVVVRAIDPLRRYLPDIPANRKGDSTENCGPECLVRWWEYHNMDIDRPFAEEDEELVLSVLTDEKRETLWKSSASTTMAGRTTVRGPISDESGTNIMEDHHMINEGVPFWPHYHHVYTSLVATDGYPWFDGDMDLHGLDLYEDIYQDPFLKLCFKPYREGRWVVRGREKRWILLRGRDAVVARTENHAENDGQELICLDEDWFEVCVGWTGTKLS